MRRFEEDVKDFFSKANVVLDEQNDFIKGIEKMFDITTLDKLFEQIKKQVDDYFSTIDTKLSKEKFINIDKYIKDIISKANKLYNEYNKFYNDEIKEYYKRINDMEKEIPTKNIEEDKDIIRKKIKDLIRNKDKEFIKISESLAFKPELQSKFEELKQSIENLYDSCEGFGNNTIKELETISNENNDFVAKNIISNINILNTIFNGEEPLKTNIDDIFEKNEDLCCFVKQEDEYENYDKYLVPKKENGKITSVNLEYKQGDDVVKVDFNKVKNINSLNGLTGNTTLKTIMKLYIDVYNIREPIANTVNKNIDEYIEAKKYLLDSQNGEIIRLANELKRIFNEMSTKEKEPQLKYLDKNIDKIVTFTDTGFDLGVAKTDEEKKQADFKIYIEDMINTLVSVNDLQQLFNIKDYKEVKVSNEEASGNYVSFEKDNGVYKFKFKKMFSTLKSIDNTYIKNIKEYIINRLSKFLNENKVYDVTFNDATIRETYIIESTKKTKEDYTKSLLNKKVLFKSFGNDNNFKSFLDKIKEG